MIASSWSQNPRKGADVLAWLDRNLDPERFELTFVGQSQQRFERIRHAPPVDSHGVARLLREHDVYLAASRDDPCSNALLEALACGLPAAYLDSGGHPELVGGGGLPFDSAEEVPGRARAARRRSRRVSRPHLGSVARLGRGQLSVGARAAVETRP